MFHSCDFSHTGSLSAAESEIITLARYLRPRKIVVKHSYSYPDGSLYQVARSDESASQLEEMINRTIHLIGSKFLKGCRVTEIEAAEDPYKALCETTEEYFTKGGWCERVELERLIASFYRGCNSKKFRPFGGEIDGGKAFMIFESIDDKMCLDVSFDKNGSLQLVTITK